MVKSEIRKMTDSALFEALAALTPWEQQNLRKWLHSPAFNHRAEPVRLFEYCCDCLRNGRTPEAGAANQAVFGKTDSGNKLRHEMSALLSVIWEFLIAQELAADPGRRELYWVQAARKRGLEKNLQYAFREAEKSAEKTGKADLPRYLLDFQLTLEKYEWDLQSRRAQIFPAETLTTALNNWYAGQLMQLACMAEAQGAVRRQARFAPDWIALLLEQIPGRPHENTPVVALYHLGHRMLTRPEETDLPEKFRLHLAENLPELPRDAAKGLLMMAINHNIRRINEGQREAVRSVLGFYLLGLEQKLLQDERGTLSKFTYNNVLMTFLALQEWEQAAGFLEQYRPQLPAGERDNIYRYNLAVFRFRQGDYDGALELLRDVSFPDAMYNLESRKMLLKIYFEQASFAALESLLENLMTWLRRHGELGYHREMYRNLARYTARLLRLPPGDQAGRRKLAQKIRETPLVAEREWLLGKVQT